MTSKANLLIPMTSNDLGGSVAQRLETVVACLPEDHLAYVDAVDSLTYPALYQAAIRLASALNQVDAPPDAKTTSLVAVVTAPTMNELVGMLGVALSGHTFMMLDSNQGDARLLDVLATFPFQAFITTSDRSSMLQGIGKPVVCIDSEEHSMCNFQIPWRTFSSPLGVYFTSGSTGNPQGVVRTHGGALHAAYDYAIASMMCPDDRITLTSSLSLGMAYPTVMGALLNGATLYRRLDALASPAAFYQWLKEDQITIARASAGVIRSMVPLSGKMEPLIDLRMLDTGGESFTREEIDQLLRLLMKEGVFQVRLSANEAGNYAMFRVRAGEAWEGERNPAGYPPAYTKVSVVDEERQELPAGEEGELAVTSRYLAAGYLNDEEQTAAKFVGEAGGERTYFTGDMGRMREDGQIEFVGRRDFRVKIRGYTIELEAVDEALRRLPWVEEGVTVVQELPSGNKRLVGYIVERAGEERTISETREALGERIPGHMIPAVIVKQGGLPKTATGKVDRKALALPGLERPVLRTVYVGAESEEEREIVGVWERLLDVKPVGVEDNFFELGGDSLMSMQMILEVEQQMGVEVPNAFFQNATIRNLILLVEGKYNRANANSPEASPWQVTTNRSRSNWQHRKTRGTRSMLLAGFKKRLGAWLLYQITRQSYSTGMKVLQFWLKQPWLQSIFFKRHLKIFTHFLKSTVGTTEDCSTAFSLALMSNFLGRRVGKLIQQKPSQLPRFWCDFFSQCHSLNPITGSEIFQVTGYADLRAAYEMGKGVILISYHGNLVNKLLPTWIRTWFPNNDFPVLSPRIGIRNAQPSNEKDMIAENALLQHPVGQGLFGGTVIMDGYRTLTSGGMVQAYVDNSVTSQGDWPIDVAGKAYGIRRGWADLGVETGACVIPVVIHLGVHGQVHIRFGKAFNLGLDTMPYEDRVGGLASQFAEFLSDSFRTHPESLKWKTMQRHVKQPEVGK
ncbi:MAG: non-ribosomal peptide synthetase [Anaerolineae bacterium]|nr:non-ribosomal peptide synthetase [Anaerolineae bacterium]